ncbi:MAG: TRAP transporter substrate-binding protein [Rhodospirillales bacterium]|nr:TRAP transporter substrate-binding protein [Rhodospirillales bacterium]
MAISCGRRQLIGTVAAGIAAAAVAAVPAAAADFEFTFQSSNQAGEANYELQKAWGERVQELSGGRIKLDVLPVGSVVDYKETLDAVGSGILGGHITDASYWAGRDPAYALLGNFVGAWGSPNELYLFIYYGGGKELFNELHNDYGLQFLGAATTGLEAFVTKKTLSGVADLQGLKMRAPEGMVQDVFAAAGASPVNLPFSEVYTALDKGVIDAADATVFSVNHKSGLHKVAPNPVYPGFHSMPTIEVSMNKDAYDKLPADLQRILESSVVEFSFRYAGELELADSKVAAEAMQDPAVTVTSWSETERTKFRQIAQDVWKTYAGRSDMSKKVYDAIIAHLQATGKL